MYLSYEFQAGGPQEPPAVLSKASSIKSKSNGSSNESKSKAKIENKDEIKPNGSG